MLRALRAAMRLLAIPVILLAAACADEPTVTGTLAEGGEAARVWVVGGPEGAAVTADSFHLEQLPEGALDLRFADEEGEELARMEVEGLPAGARLELRRVWFRDGLAVPSGVGLEGAEWVLVNGLRMGPAAALPDEVDLEATVLAVSDEGEALVVRPVDEARPDLRVVVTPGTLVRSPDGDPLDPERLEFGDSLRVRGRPGGEYVVASELVLPRDAGRDDG